MRLYCNHEEEAAGISDEEMVDGDANIDDEEMVDGDANIDDEVMVDANIDDNDEDEEMVDANIDDKEMVDANIDDEKMVNFEVVEVTGEGPSVNVPSPIQSHALPFLLDRRDLIGIAKSGSGKTLAFGIPALVHVLCKKKLGDSGRACPWCSILSPTRELAQQKMSLYCNHEEEAASISDEEMVDVDANIDDKEMVDGDANIDDE
ncbi:hypothetical protein Sjap_022043 [Stephania japonica]|uniref:DEAD/DEAH-box helicase domain-containing protein n=1 Tax=Stephania japonica TaxID=461633 RepID=A0AAP0EN48_9MAGN